MQLALISAALSAVAVNAGVLQLPLEGRQTGIAAVNTNLNNQPASDNSGFADLIWGSSGIPVGGAVALNNHGGPVMSSANLYAIFYGSHWTAANTAQYVDFLTNLGTSTWFQNSLAITGGSAPVFKKSVIMTGSNLGAPSTYQKAITTASNTLGVDGKGIYNLFADPTAAKGLYLVSNGSKYGYLSYWCGFHSNMAIGSTTVYYSIIGTDGGLSATGCNWIGMLGTAFTTPNIAADPNLDAAATAVAHEIAETMTDPLGTAFWDASGNENGDKCNFWPGVSNFVNEANKGTGAQIYSAQVGTHKYLLQTNFNQASASCPLTIW